MRDSIKIGSKRENAKQITLKVTPNKIFLFVVVILIIAFGVMQITKPLVKDLYENEIMVKCNTGEVIPIEFNKTYYCNEHYTKMEKLSNFDRIEEIILEGE